MTTSVPAPPQPGPPPGQPVPPVIPPVVPVPSQYDEETYNEAVDFATKDMGMPKSAIESWERDAFIEWAAQNAQARAAEPSKVPGNEELLARITALEDPAAAAARGAPTDVTPQSPLAPPSAEKVKEAFGEDGAALFQHLITRNQQMETAVQYMNSIVEDQVLKEWESRWIKTVPAVASPEVRNQVVDKAGILLRTGQYRSLQAALDDATGLVVGSEQNPESGPSRRNRLTELRSHGQPTVPPGVPAAPITAGKSSEQIQTELALLVAADRTDEARALAEQFKAENQRQLGNLAY